MTAFNKILQQSGDYKGGYHHYTSQLTVNIMESYRASDCENINKTSVIPEQDQSALETLLPSGRAAPTNLLCNGRCDWHISCEDEALCNGYKYGAYCNSATDGKLLYLKADKLCYGSAEWFCETILLTVQLWVTQTNAGLIWGKLEKPSLWLRY